MYVRYPLSIQNVEACRSSAAAQANMFEYTALGATFGKELLRGGLRITYSRSIHINFRTETSTHFS